MEERVNNQLRNDFNCLLQDELSSKLVELIDMSASLYDWRLLYHACHDGFSAKEFHERCDGIENTLTVVISVQYYNIFGGFTTKPWDSSGDPKDDSQAFLFSLCNELNMPMLFRVKDEGRFAIYGHRELGPTFGFGTSRDGCTWSDLRINSDCTYGHTALGFSYESQPKAARSYENFASWREWNHFLAGRNFFNVHDLAVFQRVERFNDSDNSMLMIA